MGYERLDWDSEFFGRPIGRVGDGDEPLVSTVGAADADGIECLYLLCPAAETEDLQTALALGFRPYDVRIEFSRALLKPPSAPAPLGTRDAQPGDEPALESIARDRLTETRFGADPHFPPDRVGDLYVAWLRRGLATPPLRRTLVAGAAEGFVTCRFDAERGVGAIELIAVAAGREGAGLGNQLMAASSRAFADAGVERAEVVTQGRNVAAQRLYQRHGYRTARIDLWLHRWVRD